MYCIKLSILPQQLFMFNDFNDLETFRASDKRTSSDFKNISNTWIYLKLLQAIMDIVPAPLKQLYHICCSLAYTRVGRENLQNLIWDEVPTMVEIAIFWFQIHITNGLNSLHQKWHTGNQYMVKSAEYRMRSDLEGCRTFRKQVVSYLDLDVSYRGKNV